MENTAKRSPHPHASPWPDTTQRSPRPPHPLWSSFVLLIILTINISMRGVHGVPSYEFAVPMPEFGETLSELNVTSFTGHTSRLPCTVRHLAGKQVSWIRLRDLTVLSSGRITFATDVRITVLPGTNGAKRIGRSVNDRTGLRALFPVGDNREENARSRRQSSSSDLENSESLPDVVYNMTPKGVEGQQFYVIEDEQSSDIGMRINNKRLKRAHWDLVGGSGYSPQIFSSKQNYEDSMEQSIYKDEQFSIPSDVSRSNVKSVRKHKHHGLSHDHNMDTTKKNSINDHRVIENADYHPLSRYNDGEKTEINSRKKSRVVRTNRIISSWDTESLADPYSNDDKTGRLSYKDGGRDRLSDPDSGTEFDSTSFNRILHKSTSKVKMYSRNSHYSYDDSVAAQTPASRIHVVGVTPKTDNQRNSPSRVTVTLLNSAGIGHLNTAQHAGDDPSNLPSSLSSSSSSSSLPQNYLEGVWEPEDFTLQIKYTEPGDAGTYVCQVNTEPKTAQKINLTVIDMVAKILGPKELFVKEGTSVTLVCNVDHSASLPGFIFWYKGNRLVDYESSKGRIQVIMRREGRSDLVMKEARQEDSSNYTCGPAGGLSASVLLSVIVDERPAAMQQGNSATSPRPMGIDHMLLVGMLVATVLLGAKCTMSEDESKQISYLEHSASSLHTKNSNLARKYMRYVSCDDRQKAFGVISKQKVSPQMKGKCPRLFSSHSRPSKVRWLYDRRSLEERIEIDREIQDRKSTKRKYCIVATSFP